MDLSIGDRVFYTCSNGLRPTTVVGTAEDGLLRLEYYQDGLRVVNRQYKMESISFAIPSLDSPPDCHLPCNPNLCVGRCFRKKKCAYYGSLSLSWVD